MLGINFPLSQRCFNPNHATPHSDRTNQNCALLPPGIEPRTLRASGQCLHHCATVSGYGRPSVLGRPYALDHQSADNAAPGGLCCGVSCDVVWLGLMIIYSFILDIYCNIDVK